MKKREDGMTSKCNYVNQTCLAGCSKTMIKTYWVLGRKDVAFARMEDWVWVCCNQQEAEWPNLCHGIPLQMGCYQS